MPNFRIFRCSAAEIRGGGARNPCVDEWVKSTHATVNKTLPKLQFSGEFITLPSLVRLADDFAANFGLHVHALIYDQGLPTTETEIVEQ